jgi:hypothetical protein
MNVLEQKDLHHLVLHFQIIFQVKSLRSLAHQSLLILQRFSLVQEEVSVAPLLQNLHVLR